MNPCISQPMSASRITTPRSSSSSGIYVLIFLVSIGLFSLLRKQESYAKWVATQRQEDWSTMDGLNHRSRRRLALDEPEESQDEQPSEEAPETASEEEEEAETTKEEEEDQAIVAKDDGMERAREELEMLERAVEFRGEEERLYVELMETSGARVRLEDPPEVGGEADGLLARSIDKELVS